MESEKCISNWYCITTWRQVLIFIFAFILYSQVAISQNDSSVVKRQWFYINGYIKDLQLFSFKDDADSIYLTNEIHNRLNFKIALPENFEINAGIRNRLFVGDQVKMIPGFADQINNDEGYMDLTFNWFETNSMVMNTTFDRLNVDWKKNKMHFRVGRQRINWGINLTWNPNDIFNSYNFLDFDYEERPGTDAVLAEYNITDFSGIDFAFSPSHEKDDATAALRYRVNTHGYDLQFIGGVCKTDIVAGAGWAGSIGEAGFKGEATYFHPKKEFTDSTGSLSASIAVDYSFKKGWYVNASALYNGYADINPQNILMLADRTLSAKNLMPDVYSFMLQTSKSFSPLFSANFSVVYSPETKLIILLPYANYSVTNSFDLDLYVQSYFAENFEGEVEPVNNSVFLRMRWSF